MDMQELLDKFHLPELPDEADEADKLAELFISQFKDPKIYLERLMTVEDAQTYCSRDDTHGNGWFVGYYLR